MNRQLSPWQRLSSRTLSIDQVRSVDQLAIDQYGMHSLVLMENAALGCSQWLQARFDGPQSTTILCGRGNNGGDGLAIARHLLTQGWPCQVIQHGPVDKLSSDALANFRILTSGQGTKIHLTEGELSPAARASLASSTVIIDALLGTGASGAPRAPLDAWIETANRLPAARIAIDVPTGIDAETGVAPGIYFQASATLTFVARKPGMNHPDGASLFGEVVVLPIGIPAQMILKILGDIS